MKHLVKAKDIQVGDVFDGRPVGTVAKGLVAITTDVGTDKQETYFLDRNEKVPIQRKPKGAVCPFCKRELSDDFQVTVDGQEHLCWLAWKRHAEEKGVPGPDTSEHPEGYEGECYCMECLEYGA